MAARGSTVQRFRARQKSKGLRRFEVHLRAEDAGLIRRVATALATPERRVEVRSALARLVGGVEAPSLKALLAQAPSLDDIDLERSREIDRAVDL